MTLVVLILAFALVLAGAGSVLWFVIQAWVAGRAGGKLAGRDYRLLAAGLLAIGLGLAGLKWSASRGTTALPVSRQSPP